MNVSDVLKGNTRIVSPVFIDMHTGPTLIRTYLAYSFEKDSCEFDRNSVELAEEAFRRDVPKRYVFIVRDDIVGVLYIYDCDCVYYKIGECQWGKRFLNDNDLRTSLYFYLLKEYSDVHTQPSIDFLIEDSIARLGKRSFDYLRVVKQETGIVFNLYDKGKAAGSLHYALEITD